MIIYILLQHHRKLFDLFLGGPLYVTAACVEAIPGWRKTRAFNHVQCTRRGIPETVEIQAT